MSVKLDRKLIFLIENNNNKKKLSSSTAQVYTAYYCPNLDLRVKYFC